MKYGFKKMAIGDKKIFYFMSTSVITMRKNMIKNGLNPDNFVFKRLENTYEVERIK